MLSDKSFSERVREAVAEFADIGNVPVDEIKGGFTGASKFRAGKYFLKVADVGTHSLDAFLVESEANIYSILRRIGLTKKIFPEYFGLVDKNGLKVLIVEFLSQVTWGGPWNYETIKYLDMALERLHTTRLLEKDRDELMGYSDAIRKSLGQKTKKESTEAKDDEEKNKPFFEAWDDRSLGFKDALGKVYFVGESDFPKRIIEESLKGLYGTLECLVMHDLNFANIGFDK